MTDTEFQSKLAEYEDVIRLLTAKLEELAAENARLRSEKGDALSVLKEVYNDPAASPAHRIKAAGLALPHEVPRLTPVPPAIDLPCEEIEPLAVLVEKRRARQNLLCPESIEPGRALPVARNGNGSDSGSND